ncbi:hypothetical protein, conserved [Angomonas deanei]|uniref:Uncharacterized protein n=1 Tax=Angomonas deanei TaxID=59799 RepID=A0A7G2CCJ1_9TRYP|nr:hypothetical protein, conserved [Angomonas deanei]
MKDSSMGRVSHLNTSQSVPVQSLVNDLIEISQSIALYLEQEPVQNQGVSDRNSAALKAQEIERIVRRVESHYVDKLEAAKKREEALLRKVELLSEGAKESGDPGSNALRQSLLAEKRQRLQVEEQTQQMAEQHVKVVNTLEKRLTKQENQLRELLSIVESRGSSETTTSTNTPRRLLRQQLAQHQETQRALEQYRQQIFDGSGGPADIPETFTESSDPVVETPAVNEKTARGGDRMKDVDDITNFLDNITRELESLSA